MHTKPKDIIILGAGLAGLCTAYLLKKNNIDSKILEARNRIGGRILSIKRPGEAKVEMGATWLGKKHRNLIDLLQSLDIDIFPQVLGKTAVYEPISTSPPQIVRLPPNDEPSFRIKHGTSSLIDALAAHILQEQIYLNTQVQSIETDGRQLILNTSKKQFRCDLVISTLPPALFFDSVKTSPSLPSELIELGLGTHTWMGESIKVALRYKDAFWQKNNLSGSIFSSVGPIPEMYDHSDYENKYYALMGFLNGAYYNLSKEERLQMIMIQLKKYYGEIAEDYLSYEELVWVHEKHTSVPYSRHVLPHENNGHPLYQASYLQDRLFFAGSETSSQFGGYMDGAVSSAMRVVNQVSAIV